MAYTFSGSAKTITLSSGTVAVDLADLYSRYKDWLLSTPGAAGFLPAFRTVGGDIPAIPLYLFLLNGWRIVPQAANHVLTVDGGVLEVEGGGDPFVDPAGSWRIRINRQTPGIAIGYSTSGGASGPSAAAIAAAVWSYALEAGLSAEAVQRVVLAALAGKSLNVGGSTETYLGQDGTTARIVATFDGDGNRTSVAVNGA